MKVLYKERSSDPLWPRVMRWRPRGRGRSVDRGASEPGIEPRKVTKIRSASAVKKSEGQHHANRHREVVMGSARSKTLCALVRTSNGNREIPHLAEGRWPWVRAVNPKGRRRR